MRKPLLRERGEDVAPLVPGDRVLILRPLQLIARPQYEGRATLIEPIPGERDGWLIAFDGEKSLRRRLVPVEWWLEPERTLEILQAQWRSGASPELFDEAPAWPRHLRG